jgi:hypothetical protein
MVGTSVPPQLGHWDQDALADSSRCQAPSRHQIVQCPLANGENLRSIPPTQEQLLFDANFRFLVGK